MMNKLPKLILILSVLSSVITLGARFYIVTKLSTKGSEMVRLEREINILSKENERLVLKIAEEASLSKVKDRALALGMNQEQKADFLTPAISASANPTAVNGL